MWCRVESCCNTTVPYVDRRKWWMGGWYWGRPTHTPKNATNPIQNNRQRTKTTNKSTSVTPFSNNRKKKQTRINPELINWRIIPIHPQNKFQTFSSSHVVFQYATIDTTTIHRCTMCINTHIHKTLKWVGVVHAAHDHEKRQKGRNPKVNSRNKRPPPTRVREA